MDSENVKNGDDQDQLSTDERKVYDRQIRLWGFNAQNKIRTTKVLLIGMQGLGAEIAKNLILSGIKSITLKDHTEKSALDRCSQFLIPRDSVERNRAKASLIAAQKLNPNVQVTVDTTPIEENNDTFVANFDIVIATECFPSAYKRLNEDCRKAKVKLFIGDVYGLFGYFYQDVNFTHTLYGNVFPIGEANAIPPKRAKQFYLTNALLKFQTDSIRKPNPITSDEDIVKIKSIIDGYVKQEYLGIEALEEYYSELFCELSPTTSIIGAMISQTAINTLMDKTVQNYNVFFYDHIEHEGKFNLL